MIVNITQYFIRQKVQKDLEKVKAKRKVVITKHKSKSKIINRLNNF